MAWKQAPQVRKPFMPGRDAISRRLFGQQQRGRLPQGRDMTKPADEPHAGLQKGAEYRTADKVYDIDAARNAFGQSQGQKKGAARGNKTRRWETY